MKSIKAISILFVAFTMAAVTLGCANNNKAPNVSSDVRHALDQAGLNDVSVSQDRDKGVVTLGGNVAAEVDKERAESVAKSVAGAQVIANEIGVRPKGDESTAKTVDSDLDSAIDKNLSAALVQRRLKHDVRYDVKNGVVTLKGDADSQAQRTLIEKLASAVPNVKQVVNEMEVKNQKATSTK